jgi:hypothetical protein
MGRFRAVRRKLQAQSLDLRPWAIHPQAIWWTADSGVTRADATADALSTWTPANLVDWAGSEPELIETADTGEHSISDTGTGSLVIGPTKLSVELESVGRNWAWVKLGTGTLIAHFDLANGLVGTVGAGATAVIEAGSEAGRWRCTVYGVTAATNMAVGASPADGVTSYEGSVGLSAIKARSPVLTQHRVSGWTSRVYGNVAGPAMAQANSAYQLFVQADATSPGGLSLFGKPCLWIPGSSVLYLASSAAAAKSLMNGPLSVSALVCLPGAATTAYVCYGTGTNEIRMLVDANGKPYVNVPDLGYAGYSDIALQTDVPSVVTYHADPSTGAWSVDIDGIVTSGTFASSWVPGDTSAVSVSPRAAGIRELVLSPPLSAARRAAMRSGMRQRLAA